MNHVFSTLVSLLLLMPMASHSVAGGSCLSGVSTVYQVTALANAFQQDSVGAEASEATDNDTAAENESAAEADETTLPQTAETDSQTANQPDRRFHGFLPTRGSVMLDFVFLGMLLILPVMQFSIFLAQQKRYLLHRNLQIGSAIVLLAAVVLFEVDMRFFTDWRALAEASSLYPWCSGLLYFHLCFAVPTPFIWGWVIYGALRNLDENFQGSYVAQHRMAGKVAAILMYGTGLTGILFYVVAFVF